MCEKINITMTVQVVGGPQISESLTKLVEAYDKIQVTIAANASDKKVQVQPGCSGQVQLLMIRLTDSKHYGDGVTYKVNDGTAVNTLDAPQVLMGKGGVKLLDPAPNKLFFTNTQTEDVSVEILVGRDATPKTETTP